MPSSSAHRSSPDIEPKLLTRVRALLAKAESTEFPEEAEALTAKAQDLMARHAIDRALLTGPDAELHIEQRPFTLERPYLSPKALLLGQVAAANNCQAIGVADDRVEVFGRAGDIDAVELLFTSLLVQATAAMLTEGAVVAADGRSRTRSFRHAFLVSFAHHVGGRLRATVSTAIEDADADTGAALVPLFAEQRRQVDDAVRSAFPHVTTRRTQVSSAVGLEAGRAAAARADLGRGRMGAERAALTPTGAP